MGGAIADESDPDRMAALTEQRKEGPFGVLAVGALSRLKDDVLAEREQFRAGFGESE